MNWTPEVFRVLCIGGYVIDKLHIAWWKDVYAIAPVFAFKLGGTGAGTFSLDMHTYKSDGSFTSPQKDYFANDQLSGRVVTKDKPEKKRKPPRRVTIIRMTSPVPKRNVTSTSANIGDDPISKFLAEEEAKKAAAAK